MNDLERTKQHFVSLGYTEVPMNTRSFHHSLKALEFYVDPEDNGFITINFGDGGGAHGYRAFGFCLAFKEDGSFAGHGAYE